MPIPVLFTATEEHRTRPPGTDSRSFRLHMYAIVNCKQVPAILADNGTHGTQSLLHVATFERHTAQAILDLPSEQLNQGQVTGGHASGPETLPAGTGHPGGEPL